MIYSALYRNTTNKFLNCRLSGTRPVVSGLPAATGARRLVSSSPLVPPVVAKSLPPSPPCLLWLTTASSTFLLVTPRPSLKLPTSRRSTVAPPGVPVPMPAPLVPASPPLSSSRLPLSRARPSLRLCQTDYMVARRRSLQLRRLPRPMEMEQHLLLLLLLRHQSRSLSHKEKKMAKTISVVCQ